MKKYALVGTSGVELVSFSFFCIWMEAKHNFPFALFWLILKKFIHAGITVIVVLEVYVGVSNLV